jgi:O-succinylbenzoic acid--CoA ligase
MEFLELERWSYTLRDKTFLECVQQIETELNVEGSSGSQLIIERDPLLFLAKLWVCLKRKQSVFLCNPDWQTTEWLSVKQQVQEQLKGYNENQEVGSAMNEPLLMIPTGGTTSGVRFAVHSWQNLITAAKSLAQAVSFKQLSTYAHLPLFHVSGLMPIVRALVTGGKVYFSNEAVLQEKAIYQQQVNHNLVISIVPTQLYRYLEKEEQIAYLRNFDIIFVGGGPLNNQLIDKALHHQLPLALTYGMTETAGMVTALFPENFKRYQCGFGNTLPHAQVEIVDSDAEGIGTIRIQAESLYYGYYPFFTTARFGYKTEDLGYWEAADSLQVIGRKDRILISGGEKIALEEIESIIWAMGLIDGIRLTSETSLEWGQSVTAYYNPKPGVTEQELISKLKAQVVNYKVPKRWIVDKQLCTARGKLIF